MPPAHYPPIQIFLGFCLLNAILAFCLMRKNSRGVHDVELKTRHLQEAANILNDKNSKDRANKVALQAKIRRYNSLKEIIEEISQNLNLDSISETLASIAFSFISNNKGTCSFYLIDEQAQKLSLVKSKKEDRKLVIKAKEGDIFDLWVLKHANPLFIENINKDFRFDLDKLKQQDIRPISSLISAPFVSKQRFLGILRLDAQQPNFYSQDDLRFLVTICDLGAVAIENSEYFEKAQDLAIHDGLTSLYKKGYFLERLREECKRNARRNSPVSLLLLDIDYFKNYNDKFGHTAGDIVLKGLSYNLVDFLRDRNALISRFGGEEFCVVLPGIEKKKAALIAEELRARVEREKIILRGQETHITVSIGVASFPNDVKGETELIVKADKAMYEAKKDGRNRVVVA